MIGLQVTSWPGHLPAAPPIAWFGPQGGDIGRSGDCTLTLPDPERHISRRHAVVVQRQGQYFLQAMSSGLPLTIDGAALPMSGELALQVGMQVSLGGYVLQVLDEPESVGGVGQPPAPVALTMVPPQEEPEIDLLLGDTGQVPASPPRAAGPLAQPPAAPAPPPIQAPKAPRPVEPAAQRAAGPGPQSAPLTDGDLAAALLHGLGMAPLAPGGLDAERAERLGALLREMTQGTLELLTARMVAKRELGAASTQLRTRENNPLKFSPDVDTALGHLLGPAERGFLDPQTAVREAFDDLRTHQVALLAGMRAALDSVMSRFDPAALEKRLTPGGALENLIPANRRARLWSAYGEEYARIVGEIEDDFDALLGRAFLKAYQAQLQALGADRKRGGEP